MTEPKLIPQQFFVQKNVIASYDFYDFAEGTGIVTFYGMEMNDYANSHSVYLVETAGYSSRIEANNPATTTSYAAEGTYTFDLSAFNNPKTIKGTARVNLGHCVQGNAGQGEYGYIRASVCKWDGATETVISYGDSDILYSGSATPTKGIHNISIAVAQTHFKAGEILRLKIQIYAKYVSGNTSHVNAIGFDPMNRDGTYLIPSTDSPATMTMLIFKCPFRLEV